MYCTCTTCHNSKILIFNYFSKEVLLEIPINTIMPNVQVILTILQVTSRWWLVAFSNLLLTIWHVITGILQYTTISTKSHTAPVAHEQQVYSIYTSFTCILLGCCTFLLSYDVAHFYIVTLIT